MTRLAELGAIRRSIIVGECPVLLDALRAGSWVTVVLAVERWHLSTDVQKHLFRKFSV